MLESRPSSVLGFAAGLSIVIGLLALDLGLIGLLILSPVTVLSFLWGVLLVISLPMIGLILYWVVMLRTTSYQVVDNALVVTWGAMRQVVPLHQIHTVVMGQTLATAGRFRGLRWPGFWLGQGQVHGQDGEARYATFFYATAPLHKQLLLVTDTMAYAVSPTDLENFRDCLVALRGVTLSDHQPDVASDWGFWGWKIWYDRVAHALWGTAVFLNMLLFAYLCAQYGRLPVSVPLHFNAQGVDRIGAPADLFILPLVGLLTWLVNGFLGGVFYEWHGERPLAFICWGTAVLVQMAAWGAVVGLLY